MICKSNLQAMCCYYAPILQKGKVRPRENEMTFPSSPKLAAELEILFSWSPFLALMAGVTGHV
jgi:hypothetical protein